MRLRFRATWFLNRYSCVVSGCGCRQRRRGVGRGSGFVDGDGEGKAVEEEGVGVEEDDTIDCLSSVALCAKLEGVLLQT